VFESTKLLAPLGDFNLTMASGVLAKKTFINTFQIALRRVVGAIC
jgi:hypothetical protein